MPSAQIVDVPSTSSQARDEAGTPVFLKVNLLRPRLLPMANSSRVLHTTTAVKSVTAFGSSSRSLEERPPFERRLRVSLVPRTLHCPKARRYSLMMVAQPNIVFVTRRSPRSGLRRRSTSTSVHRRLGRNPNHEVLTAGMPRMSMCLQALDPTRDEPDKKVFEQKTSLRPGFLLTVNSSSLLRTTTGV
ncbi:hypothetical protein MRX96_037194 [Rhipicephalus microplus]